MPFVGHRSVVEALTIGGAIRLWLIRNLFSIWKRGRRNSYSRIGKRGRVENSKRRGQTRVLTLCKHAVTTLVHEDDDDDSEREENYDVAAAMPRGFLRNWIFRLKTEIKYARLPRDGTHFLKLETVIYRVDLAYIRTASSLCNA